MTIDEAALRQLQGTELTIRELLAMWGYRVRNADSVPRIRFDLERVGFTTSPTFDVGSMDSTIRIVSVEPPETGRPGAGSSSEPGTEPEGAKSTGETAEPPTTPADEASNDHAAAVEEEEELPSAAMRVDDLPSARRPVVCVGPGETLAHATTLMLRLDYSQIPVLEGDSSLHGVVTWQSVARMYASQSDQVLANAMVPSPYVTIVHSGDNLLAVLPTIAACDYVLVRNQHGHICGIVTTADLAQQFGNVARPFFVIGEIERRLRGFLTPVFDRDPAVRKVTNKRTDRVGEMMFGNYVNLLRDENNWQRLGWPLIEKNLFIELLDGVREIRNAVAHFRLDRLAPHENLQVEQLRLMLKNLGP